MRRGCRNNSVIAFRREQEASEAAAKPTVLSFGGSRRLQRLLQNPRFCLSDGAGGFSPLNKANEFNGL
jgi:hypothetical protein